MRDVRVTVLGLPDKAARCSCIAVNARIDLAGNWLSIFGVDHGIRVDPAVVSGMVLLVSAMTLVLAVVLWMVVLVVLKLACCL
jgi:hypothetical protein